MAEKRMFTQKIIDSDAFLEMPLSAQALYFHLNMRADDDGFVNNPKKVTRLINASDDDLKILILKRFIIAFDSGVIVIKHWRMHNSLKMDRYHPTDYQEEFLQLGLKENRSYTDNPEHAFIPALSSGAKLEPEWSQNGANLEPENRIDKNRIDKNREDKSIEEKRRAKKFIPPTLDDVKAYCMERSSSVDPERFFDYYQAGNWKDAKGNPVRNWKQKLITWERRQSDGNGKRTDNQSVPATNPDADKERLAEFARFRYDV